jgi:dipeptidyl aminopeptidase/acylaminoacyl peptidase
MRPYLLSIVSLCAACLTLNLIPRPVDAAVLQPADYTRFRSINSVELSPDGKIVLYAVNRIDAAKDSGTSQLWVSEWDKRSERRLPLGSKQPGIAHWSPDGKRIAFISPSQDVDARGEVWTIEVASGKLTQLTRHDDDVQDFAWSPDGRRMVLTLQDPPDSEGNADTAPIVISNYSFMNEDGYDTGDHTHLAILDISRDKTFTLTSGDSDEQMATWSPDSKRIVFLGQRGVDPDRTDVWNVFVIDARPEAVARQLTDGDRDNGAPDFMSPPAWSPDGQAIAFLRGGDPKLIDYASDTLSVVPADGGEIRDLTSAVDRRVYSPQWIEHGRAVALRVEEDRHEHLDRVDMATGKVTTITPMVGNVQAFDVADDGRIALLWSTALHPAEVYAWEPDATRRALSHQNDALMATLEMGRVEETSFHSADGTEVHGFLVMPPHAVQGTRYPAILWNHGGPVGQFSAGLPDGQDHMLDLQMLAAQGYVVIATNPRGSSGRGTAYAKALFADWGHHDVEDALAGVDDAVKRGVADPEHLGVGGWSYGGMLTNALIARDTRFKAAVSGAAISNALAGYGSDLYTRQWEVEFGVPWKNPDAYLKVSFPFLHADRIKTPTLFMGGAKDFDVPLHNTEQMYQALRSLDIPTQLVIYPDQMHVFSRPSSIVDRYRRWIAWYARWLKSAG